MVELRFLRKPEKMDNTLRLFFLLSDWAWWKDDNWLKGKETGEEIREALSADNKVKDEMDGNRDMYNSHLWLSTIID